jgi:hypothetical protein
MKLQRSEISNYADQIYKNEKNFDQVENEFRTLGMSEGEISDATKAINKRLNMTIAKNKYDIENETGYFAIGMIITYVYSFVAATIDNISIFWMLISCILMGLVGYIFVKENAKLGVAIAILYFLTAQYVIPVYMEGRTSIIRIEGLIIGFLCFIPSYLLLELYHKFDKK